MARTQAQRIADRAAARQASGQSLTRRQQKNSSSSSSSSNRNSGSSSRNSGGSSSRNSSSSSNRNSGSSNRNSSGNSSRSNGRAQTGLSVAQRRAAAKSANQTMAEYRAAQGITQTTTRADKLKGATDTKGNISNYNASSVGAKNDKYSHNDIRALRGQGYSLNDIGKHLYGLGDDANLGSRAEKLRQKYVDSLTTDNGGGGGGTTGGGGGGTTGGGGGGGPVQTINTGGGGGGGTRPTNPTLPGGPVTKPGVGTPITVPDLPGGPINVVTPVQEQQQNVNQDNDITTTIDGNGNTVVNNQDNSIRQYGGSQRTFVYNGGSGDSKYEDTPVGAATMAGYYDVDDSPAEQAKRFDFWSTQNKDAQKRFAGQGLANAAMFSNFDARDYTPESMQNAIYKSMQYSYDRGDVQTGITLGDIWRPDYAPDWRMPEAPAKIESDVEDITKDAKDDIENV